MARRKSSGFWETVRTVVYAILIALVVRTVAFEPFNIPSGSMVPSLLIGDYLFVSKYSYGYSRHSLPFSVPLFDGRLLFTEPERGDVAVFKLPRDNRTDYIKRIIGLPGDRIRLERGVVYLNGEPVMRQRIEDYRERIPEANGYAIAQFIETLPNGRAYRVIEFTEGGGLDDTQEYVVPADHYFALGDNRDNSQDSRVANGVGFIPRENLVGRAEVLFFSVNGEAHIWEVWKWPRAIRLGRLFLKVV